MTLLDPAGDERYDVMLSYAHQNRWVVRWNLYEPLCRCRTRDGRRPRIFMDDSPGGMQPGQEFPSVLASAIQRSAAFVPVYSRDFFESGWCQWELNRAVKVATERRSGTKLVPVLLEELPDEAIPLVVSTIQQVTMARDDWFQTLCDALDLVPEVARLEVSFLDQPTEAYANHTLPPVKVAVTSDGGPLPPGREETVTVSAEPGLLTGTLARTTTRGVATFADLSIGSVESGARLIASCPGGAAQARTAPFPVREPGPMRSDDHRPAGERPADLRDRRVRFLGAGALVLLAPGRLEILDPDGRQVASRSVDGTPRLLTCSDTMVVLATWEGRVHVGSADGRFSRWDFGRGRQALTVPGDVTVTGEGRLLVGFWNGEVYSMAAEEDWRPDLEVEHPAGVQALAVAGERCYVCGLDGRLCVYERGREVAAYQLEPTVWLVKAFKRALVVVGATRLFQIPIDRGEPHEEPLPAGEVVGVFGDTKVPVVVYADGQGIRFDQTLEIRSGFRVAPGAQPWAADSNGRCCVLANPDGSYSLVVDGRVIQSHPRGGLAVSPEGDRLALVDGQGIDIVPFSVPGE